MCSKNVTHYTTPGGERKCLETYLEVFRKCGCDHMTGTYWVRLPESKSVV